jgi:hydroxyacylglutathione hydrolase
MNIEIIPAFSDNYVYLLRDPDTDAVGVVDPGDAGPVLAALDRLGWRLTHIFNTHHHNDHIGGNRILKDRYGAPVIGPRADADRIPDLDLGVGDGDSLKFGSQDVGVLEVPGHTRAHIAFWFPDAGVLFPGDTLFALGCGRLFEGTPEQMWHSLGKLRDLPADTRIYCGHEYTQSNARFALSIDPDNPALRERAAHIDALRAEGRPTIPSTLGEERLTNPFLRADDPDLSAAVGLAGGDPVAVFAEIRRRKDHF